jgi:imidazolonepropionase-like amidohydrolase
MLKRLLAVAWLLLLAAWLLLTTACQRSGVKVLIGGTAIVAPGAAPIEDSIIVVAGHTVRSVGRRKDVPVPQDSERVDVSGKWVVPAEGGRIAPGETANLAVLNKAPAQGGRDDVARSMKAGEWEQVVPSDAP